MKLRSRITLVLIFVLTACSHASNTRLDRNATVIELADLLRIFTPPLTSNLAGINWRTGADEDAPQAIVWKTNGLEGSHDAPYSAKSNG